MFSGICQAKYSPDFLEYMKGVENGIKSGWDSDKSLWFPHNSVEGGNKTIAYGHKIKDGESFKDGITEEEAIGLLLTDLDFAKQRVIFFLKKEHKINFNLLPMWKQEIFIDYQFNGVLKAFPKFVKAVLAGDLASMKREYKRRVKGLELKNRNLETKRRYLMPLEKTNN